MGFNKSLEDEDGIIQPLPARPDSKEVQMIKELNSRLESVERALKSASVRYSWEDKVADGGIILQGPSTVTRTGVMLAAIPIPTGPQQMTIAFLMREDGTGKIGVVPIENAKQLE